MMQLQVCFLCLLAVSATPHGHGESLLQQRAKELTATEAGINPIKRVVSLLKEMQNTIQKEMDEDEALYKTLACWCNTGSGEKTNQISDSEAKINELTASIESLAARKSELETKIKELEAEVAANKAELAQAKALRAKQLEEFHGTELDAIQAVENIKAALVVLTKHTDGGESTNWHEFVQLNTVTRNKAHKDSPLGLETSTEHSLDSFMRTTGMDESAVVPSTRFLQSEAAKIDDTAIVKRAMRTMASFMQAHGEEMGPSYSSNSGEIVGVMKQLKDEMEADLTDAQRVEQERGANFAELSASKTQEIEEGEKMSEQKEDELATTAMDLAEAKEDLEQTQTALGEFQTFLKNLESSCAEADKNFEARRAVRLDEVKAVSMTIEILTSDEARDAANGTYSSLIQTEDKMGDKDCPYCAAQCVDKCHNNGGSYVTCLTDCADAGKGFFFLQVSNSRRQRAAGLLRRAAVKTHSPQLSLLATAVQLDAFTKVIKAIDSLIAALKTQQADEVKKNDWCKDEIQSNEMKNLKTEDLKADLEAKIGSLESSVKTLGDEIEAANAAIAENQVNLQRASENRKRENMDFQKVVADQTATREVLGKALEKLANFYDTEFLQKHSSQAKAGVKKQAPPVPQAEYKASAGATGVISMIEKLIFETKELTAESKKSEGEAQKAYETLINDTNDSIKDLMAEVSSKTEAKAQAKKDKVHAESDLTDTVGELEDVAKLNADLHNECDYVLKNFEARQNGRASETEALQQAKQILGGASA